MATNIFSGVKAVQTGYTSGAGLTTGTGEDVRYRDITITAVSDITKCFVLFDGGSATSDAEAVAKSGTTVAYECTARLTSTTNVRIAVNNAQLYIAGRWTVVEFD